MSASRREDDSCMLNRVVFVEQFASDHCDISVTFDFRHQGIQPALSRYRVVVQEHEVSPSGRPSPLIASFGESKIVVDYG